MAHPVIGVVGNPNCGKTALFNALTGSRQHVGNWPGVTVECKTGKFWHQDVEIELVDLPGTYSLDVTEESVSLDEKIARDYVAGREADLIVNIVDASNLERNLYLTSQLLEMRVPMVLALNMMDIARNKGYRVDVEALSRHLGCPVVPLVAITGEGLDQLRDTMLAAAQSKPVPRVTIAYGEGLDEALDALGPEIEAVATARGMDARWLALRLLEGDGLAREITREALGKGLEAVCDRAAAALGDDIDIAVADARYGFINTLVRDTVQKTSRVRRGITDPIDRVVLNRALGIPIFLAVMYLMFMFTINIGGAFIDFFDIFSGTLLVDGFGEILTGTGSPEWLTVLLANGIGGGLQVVATFIPIIGFMYLFLSILEDSGYMARAAFVMDRFMRFIGLPGKSFVPLIVGFGCNVPAIMATRTLEHQRDRILTMLMVPFMSCGARLPVYALFAAAFFPVGGQNVVFGLYLIGILLAMLTGLIMKHTLLQGDASPFIMELPPYHLPTLKGVLLRTWDRLKTFMLRAGKIIVPMVLVLNFLNAIGTDGSFGNEDSDQSILSEVGRTIAPAFSPMGLDKENWPAAVGIFTGVLAKEAVVGTLDAMYTALAAADAGDTAAEEPFNLWDGLGEAFASIPANLGDALGAWSDPLGIGIGDVSNIETAAENQAVATGVFGAMVARFDGTAGAFAYLLFILLYFPCVAAIAAVYRETSAGWTLFVAGWTTGLAYMAATTFYQAATFARHPGSSLAWIAGIATVFMVVLVTLRLRGNRELLNPVLVPDKA